MFLCACELRGRGRWGAFIMSFSRFFFFSFILSFLETVRGHGATAAGGGNRYNQSYFEAKN